MVQGWIQFTEPPGLTGISHFLEHLMFKGTKNLKDGEFSKIVASGGGRENAFTSFDYTGYYQKWAKDNLETSLRLEAERMTNLLFSDASVEKERQVVLEERTLRVDDSPKEWPMKSYNNSPMRVLLMEVQLLAPLRIFHQFQLLT